MGKNAALLEIYKKLLAAYAHQHWWPARGGFVPKEWEICVGAILTQNTAWSNVEKALANMRRNRCTTLKRILETDKRALERLVRPSGFFRQKARRLKAFAQFVNSFGSVELFLRNVTREQLLQVSGIGPETADSILLYAAGRPHFVVDAYTRRIFSRIGVLREESYEGIQALFEAALPRSAARYSEYHALIVQHAKRHCKKVPLCRSCPLRSNCAYGSAQ